MMKTTMNDYFSVYEAPGDTEQVIERCLRQLLSERFDERIWSHDTSLWQGDSAEIAQRLGWLHLDDTMPEHLQRVKEAAHELIQAGYTDAVLLGMGGSSLGAEVLARVLGQSDGLRIHILDSIVPSAITRVRSSIDLEHSVFIVSSKSGSTLEPNLLYEYFRTLLESKVGSSEAGAHFIAITDPDTSLDRLGRAAGFRHVFLNPADIGGRYSVGSLFGLVPGALSGVDIARLLREWSQMAQSCRPSAEAGVNAGAALGAFMAGCTLSGRDKLTIITSPEIRSFGWWAEQLIAESTGKRGKGIVPIVDEPFLSPASYSDDRAFLYIRLTNGDNMAADEQIRALTTAGQPCATIDLADRYQLGGEFFRWEYATAGAGALLRIDPFNQPNVQSAKDASNSVLSRYMAEGKLPTLSHIESADSLLNEPMEGSYVAVMAYLCRRDEVDEVMAGFRRRVGERYHIATTFGYGPRFLHSTGQLHKGGPPTGRFLQIVSGHHPDIPLPKRPYTFGVAADAQAQGDLEALRSLGRHVARIRLERDDVDQLASTLARFA